MRDLLASRRLSGLSAAAFALVFSACRPDLPQTPPDKIVIAVFDPTTASIPLPNDLVFPPFNSNLNSVCPPPADAPGLPACAQAELLDSFHGKFPNDQEVAITIDFSETDFHDNLTTTQIAPELDFATFTPSTFFVASLTATGVTEAAIDPINAADYVKAADHGTLTVHHKGNTPWPPGSYAVVMRGGANGVKTTDGTPVTASQVFSLVAQGLDLTDPANIGLLKAQFGTTEKALEQGAQLTVLINYYKLNAFKAADARFPHQELAIASTFSINSLTNVTVDAARGIVPLPIDLLRDPGPGGHLTPLAACTLAGSTLNADGTCPNPAAGGFQALDGFSTTGAILAPTSDLVIAATVRAPGAVLLFDLTNPAVPVQVPVTDLIVEPCEFTVNPATNPPSVGCLATGGVVPTAVAPVIALQPAGATAGDPSSVFRTRPLKDHTDYAVVITNLVKDKSNNALGPGTVASILRLTHPIVVGGKSALQGVDDGTAVALEKMRLQLQPVFARPEADRSKVVMAYTFRTQTILSQAVGLAALPYLPIVQLMEPASPLPVGTLTIQDAGEGFTKWGVDSNVVPSSNIDQILEVDIETLNALDPITGAFMPDPRKAAKERIHVMIATPKAANVPPNLCLGDSGPTCAPMMIFRHGLGSGRAAMLTVADTYAGAGMVTVAIDAAKHGDRSFCTSGPASPTSGCNGGAACVTALPPGAQGDAHPPGSCGAAGFVKRPVSPGITTNTDGIPAVSSNYLTTTNFFRTRDTLRQDLIDESQLVRALAFVPAGPPPTGHSVFDQMIGRGVVIDPGTIYFSGQSLGAIQGAMDVATNPRITKAALNVGGGTIVDIFINSPAFAAGTQALLDQLGIKRGTSQFLQFLVVAKTVLDPADPINFVGHLTDPARTLPDFRASTPMLQAPKKILAQIANCDGVVPNPFNLINASNVFAGTAVPLPTGAAFFAPGARGAFQLFVGPGFAGFGTCPDPSPTPTPFVAHAFLTDWAVPSLTANAQSDIANFVMSDTLPLSVQHQ